MKLCKRCDIEKNLDQFSKHSIMKDGLRSYCKECAKSDYAKRQYAPIMEGEITCRDCKEDYPFEEYYPNPNNSNGRESICRACSSEKSRQFRKKGYKFPRTSEQTERGKNLCRERAHKRRMLKKYNTIVELPKGWRKMVLDYYGNKCLICDSTQRLEVDHVVSLFKGGLDAFENMQILCIYHNRSKQTNEIDYRNGNIFYG